MAVRLSETQFNQLKELVAQLQALTSEDNQVGILVDEVMEILSDTEIDRDYREVIIDNHVIRTPSGSYII
jgi:hypothetical protein